MTAFRCDRTSIKNWEELPDGRLRIRATISRVGDLHYAKKDGSIQVEKLTEEELFNTDSLDTAGLAPVTLNHPDEGLVTPRNWRKYAVGATGSKVVAKADKGLVDVVFLVGDEDAIAAVKEGTHREVSAGYETEVIQRSDGFYYQTKRRYNHFALVPKGRAGSTVRLHFDAADDFAMQVNEEELMMTSDRSDGSGMKKYKGCDVTSEVYDAIMGMEEELANLKGKKKKGAMSGEMPEMMTDRSDASETIDKLTNQYIRVKADRDALEAQVNNLQRQLSGKLDASDLEHAIQERLTVWDRAKKFLDSEAKFDASDSPIAMQLKAIKATCPDLNLDELAKEFGEHFPTYVRATFDNLDRMAKPSSSNSKSSFEEDLAKARVGGDRTKPSLDAADDDLARLDAEIAENEKKVAAMYSSRWNGGAN